MYLYKMHRCTKSSFKTKNRKKTKNRLQKQLLVQRKSRRILIKKVIGGADTTTKKVDQQKLDSILNLIR